uniref:Cl3001_1a n=1 Tax=Arundo donax TaxID=35708 RepID=A0A0A9EQ18_ARUDO
MLAERTGGGRAATRRGRFSSEVLLGRQVKKHSPSILRSMGQ